MTCSHFSDAPYKVRVIEPIQMFMDVEDQIRVLSSLNIVTEEEFYESITKPISNLADEALCLPASEFQHNTVPCGLFKHSVKTALLATQKLLGATRTARYIAFLAALLHDVGKILYAIVKNCKGERFNPSELPLAKWWFISGRPYHLHIGFEKGKDRATDHPYPGSTLVDRILPPAVMENQPLLGRVMGLAFLNKAKVEEDEKIKKAIIEAHIEDCTNSRYQKRDYTDGHFGGELNKGHLIESVLKDSIFRTGVPMNYTKGCIFILDKITVVRLDSLKQILQKRGFSSFDESVLKSAKSVFVNDEGNFVFTIAKAQYGQHYLTSQPTCVLLSNKLFFGARKNISLFKGEIEIVSGSGKIIYSYKYDDSKERKKEWEDLTDRIIKSLFEVFGTLRQVSPKDSFIFTGYGERIIIIYPEGIEFLCKLLGIRDRSLLASDIANILVKNGVGTYKKVLFSGEKTPKLCICIEKEKVKEYIKDDELLRRFYLPVILTEV